MSETSLMKRCRYLIVVGPLTYPLVGVNFFEIGKNKAYVCNYINIQMR